MPDIDPTHGDGWEAHRREQLARASSTTPVQRLRWLEEAIAFAHRVGALPRHGTPGGGLRDAAAQPAGTPNT
jgi:hypothetical protein